MRSTTLGCAMLAGAVLGGAALLGPAVRPAAAASAPEWRIVWASSGSAAESLDAVETTGTGSAWAGGSANLRSLSCRFSKPLLAGDTIVCTGTVVSVDEEEGIATLEVSASSDRGERVLTNGRATVRLSH